MLEFFTLAILQKEEEPKEVPNSNKLQHPVEHKKECKV